MNLSLLALLLPTLCLSQNLPTNIKARFAQRDDFGSKLKVAYKINTPESSALAPNKNWMCANCEINQNGERTSNVGHETVGSTCGGYPNGCATVKPFNHHFDSPNDFVTLHFKIDEGLWSTDPIIFSTANVVKGVSGVVHLTEREEQEEEL